MADSARKQLIVFDFDGTIADTFLLALDIFQGLKKSTRRVTPEKVEQMRGMTLRQVVNELHIAWWELPLLVMRGRKLLGKRLNEAHIFTGMDSVIQQLHRQGYRLAVISSNSPDNLATFLERYTLRRYFVEVAGNARLHGKARLLTRLRKRYDVAAQDVVYIGDEARDVEASHHAGVHSVAVSWGYNNPHMLRAHKPDELVALPAEIVRYVESIYGR